jgi:hypothetical protein
LKELSPALEEALMICLEICAEFQYWLKRKTCKASLRVTLWNIQTRWVDDRPRRERVTLFQKRWKAAQHQTRPSTSDPEIVCIFL